MATKIKLMRLGKMRAPYYRIVVADARTKRDGRVIETIGKYHPKENPSFIEVDGDRAAYWLGVGAQATEPVARILKVTGDWQRFTGEAAPAPMLVREPRVDKKAVFEAAAREGLDGQAAGGSATTPRKKAAPKAAAGDAAPQAGAALVTSVATGDAAPQAGAAPVTPAAASEAGPQAGAAPVIGVASEPAAPSADGAASEAKPAVAPVADDAVAGTPTESVPVAEAELADVDAPAPPGE